MATVEAICNHSQMARPVIARDVLEREKISQEPLQRPRDKAAELASRDIEVTCQNITDRGECLSRRKLSGFHTNIRPTLATPEYADQGDENQFVDQRSCDLSGTGSRLSQTTDVSETFHAFLNSLRRKVLKEVDLCPNMRPNLGCNLL
ncbi:hypothetical protein LSH36_39g16050 [Paralvinella palmiformis]|uniref:Uncharacterized protein n=1 Tax=Paralvinella palmiformis TaxID=53620 RepID=A0AAD9K7G4_9ANNE|nr:hypothetical protein LSH36_39g16050 [Paralvinella palmiformis]